MVKKSWIPSKLEFYDSKEWLEGRYRILKINNGRCQCCGQCPSTGNPLHVDHIRPRSKFPELELTLTNLQVLCRKCNEGKGDWDETDWRDDKQRSKTAKLSDRNIAKLYR